VTSANRPADARSANVRASAVPVDTETPTATREDRLRYLAILRAAIRYRDHATGCRHFCHLMPYRPHYLRRLLELRAVLKAA
jgi:hypothetical protein